MSLMNVKEVVLHNSWAKWVYLTICTQSRYTHPCVHACTSSYTAWYMYVTRRIRGGTQMYSLVYFMVHVCTPSYRSGYMYVPRRIRQGTRKYSVICNWVLNVYRIFYTQWCCDCTYRTISSLSDRTALIVPSDAVIVHIVRYLCWVIVPHWSYPVMQ